MWEEWTTAQIALVVSGFSSLLALSSFLWNVWSKFIYPKPKLRVSLGLCFQVPEIGAIVVMNGKGELPSIAQGKRMERPAASISVTNFGPTDAKICLVIASGDFFNFRKQRMAIISLHTNYAVYNEKPHLFGGGLPRKLAVGDEASFYFPVSPEFFQANKIVRIGVSDSFGRQHFSLRKEVKALNRLTLKHIVDPIQ